MSPGETRHHRHKHRSRNHHHHSQHKNEDVPENPPIETPEQREETTESDVIKYLCLLQLISRKCKQILCDFKETNPEGIADLKVQLDILDHGYAVDVSKISNSIIQGTLQVIFSLLDIPQTNRGFFWDEEAFDGKRVYDLFYDCFTDNEPQPEQLLVKDHSNEIDLDDEEQEEEQDHFIGPSLPPAPLLTTANEEQIIGPSIPKEILEMIQQDIPVQIEEDEDIGPALPGHEERKPTEQAFIQLQPEEPTPKRLVCFFLVGNA